MMMIAGSLASMLLMGEYALGMVPKMVAIMVAMGETAV